MLPPLFNNIAYYALTPQKYSYYFIFRLLLQLLVLLCQQSLFEYLHNQNYYCDLDSIKVGGSSAKHAQDTCCDSFEERKDGNSYSNTMKEASPKSEIDCKATECMYNEQCHCHAGKISVEGGNARRCQETECATFSCGCH